MSSCSVNSRQYFFPLEENPSGLGSKVPLAISTPKGVQTGASRRIARGQEGGAAELPPSHGFVGCGIPEKRVSVYGPVHAHAHIGGGRGKSERD